MKILPKPTDRCTKWRLQLRKIMLLINAKHHPSRPSALANQRGDALVMVMVAAVIGIIVALGMASVMTNLQSSVNNVQFRADAGTLNEEMRALLSSPVACLNSFGGLAAQSGASYNITKLFDGPVPPVIPVAKYVAGNTYGAGNLTTVLKSMTLANYVPGGTPGTAQMTLTNLLLTNKQASGPQLLPRSINISLQYDLGTKAITSCIALANMSDGIWQRSSANQNNIFFNGPLAPAVGGNVGIGTSSPAALLQVSGPNANASTGTPLLRVVDTNFANGTYFAVDNGATQSAYRLVSANFNAAGTMQNLELQSGGNSNQLVLNTNGNVGIGTSGPATLLDVRSAANTTVHVMGTNSGVRGGVSADTPVGGAFYAGSYSVAPFTLGVNNAERMRIDTNGRVGIGIASPQTALDVSGGIRAGGAGAGGGCGPEGAMAYDYGAHSPLYCSNTGVWVKMGSAGTLHSNVIVSVFNSLVGGTFTCPQGIVSSCYGAYPNGTLCATTAVSDNSCTMPAGCAPVGIWAAVLTCTWIN